METVLGVVWTADGLVDAVTYPNGVATDYTYDLAGRATDIAVSGSAGAVLDLGYAYTPGSLMSSRTTARDGGVALSEDVTWDAAARLSTISSMSSGVPVQYTPSSEVTRADDGALLAWGADGSLTSRTVGADVTSYASDGLGRRVSATTASGDVTSFVWDQVGRMTGVTDTVTGSVTDYSYSAGLRIGAATTVGEDTSTAAFTWDTLAGVPLLLADATHEYIYGLGTAPVAQVDTTTGSVTFLHGDLIGSTRSATDASGTQVGSWDYTVFGETLTATGGAAGDGTGVTRFLFAGEYLDDSELYYLRARFYDPVTASFLSVDPALSATGSPYAYASGNPLQLTDPLGLWSIKGAWDSATSAVSSAVSATADAASSAVSATGNWIVENKGMLIGAAAGIVVGGGCLLLTAGAGSVACAALGGAVGGMVTYAIDTPKECWTAGGFFVSAGVGALFGGLTAGAGNALAPLASKAFTAAASRAAPAIRNAISRTVTALKPKSAAEPHVTTTRNPVLNGKVKPGEACSFAGATAVVMADGSAKAIEDIEVGDEVLAEDPVTGERGGFRVSHVWSHQDDLVEFEVEVEGGAVVTTEDHPYWNVTDGQWQAAEDFDTGDLVLTADGNVLATRGLVESSTYTGTAFNLTVEDLHTYFVVIADEGVLVHNMCPSNGTPRTNIAQNKQFKDAIRASERELGRALSKDERQIVHREISGQDFGFHDIVDTVRSLFGGS